MWSVFVLGAWAWDLAPAPDGAGDLDQLGSVARDTDGTVWVVGNTGSASSLDRLAAFWNGGAWTETPVQGGPFAFDRLTDVAVVASGDVWSVGYSANQSFTNSASVSTAFHWTGTRWQPFQLPGTPLPDDRIYSVDGSGPDDVWAVGEAFGISSGRAIVRHWDGAAWSRVAVPTPGQYSRLYAIDVLAEDDAWAVGTKFVRGNDHAFAVHWDGSAWTEFPVPAETPFQDNLVAVSGTGPDDVWAVGWVIDVIGFDQPQQTTSVHWDGVAWSVVPTPDRSTFNNRLHGVVALGPSRVWAVGTWDDGGALLTLVQRWNGAAWVDVASDDPGVYSNELSAVDGVRGDLWAVGQWSDGLVTVDPLVLRQP